MIMKSWPNCFKILKKCKRSQKLWDLSRCHDIIHEGCGKNLRRFWTWCQLRCLEIEASHRKNLIVEQDSIKFTAQVIIELWFEYKTFCTSNREQRFLNSTLWHRLGSEAGWEVRDGQLRGSNGGGAGRRLHGLESACGNAAEAPGAARVGAPTWFLSISLRLLSGGGGACGGNTVGSLRQ
jgi:hypothetical protein